MERLDAGSCVPGLGGMDHDQAGQGGLNISDVIEVIQTTDPEFADTSYRMYSGGGSSMDDSWKHQAYVKIIEQPASKALRFRYECEGRSAGSIPGVSSTPENKTFPSIQIVGYKGRAVVVVSCVTKDPPYRPHPHNLVGKEGCKKGVCTVEITSENMTVSFSNLGIQCVKKKDIDDALKVREDIRVDPFRTGFSHRSQPTSIDLNAVRLCFQVFLEGSEKGKFSFPLPPVVSDPIYDKKAMSDLTICKLSDCSSSVAGGKEIILLCEKVTKDDIQVHFVEEQNGVVVWEGYGDFQPTHVHKQVAISFRAPRYKSLEVEKPVKVFIELRRPSDGATSERLPFEFLPLDSGRPSFWSLRKALAKKGNYTMFSNILASNTAMLTGGKTLPPDPLEPTTLWGGPGKPTDSLPETGPLPEKVDAKTGDVQDKNVFTKDENENNTIGTVIMDEEVQVVEPKLELSGDKKTLYDYAEVQKWKEIASNKDDNANIEIVCDTELRNEENLRNSFNNNDISSAPTLTCRSLNELISQVAELDEIYSDTHARLLSGGGIKAPEDPLSQVQEDSQSPQIIEMDVEDLYDDNQTYSSLQMAMKNPIEPLDLVSEKYEDVIPQSPVISILPTPPSIQNNKREMSASAASITTPETPDSKLPPLPPKRVRKSPPTPPARPEHLFPHETTPVLTPPNKTLPPPPEVSPAPTVKQSKPSLFQKLFSKKPGKSGKKEGSVTPRGGSVSRQGSTGNISQAGMFQSSSDVVASETSIIIPLTGPPELTEAEHYALYTDMAPHATVSEFDEMSFYYSPVEGGNIITQSESNISRISASNRDPKRKKPKALLPGTPSFPDRDKPMPYAMASPSPEHVPLMQHVKREPLDPAMGQAYFVGRGGGTSPRYAITTTPSPQPQGLKITPSPSPHSMGRTPSPLEYGMPAATSHHYMGGGGVLYDTYRVPRLPDMVNQQLNMNMMGVNQLGHEVVQGGIGTYVPAMGNVNPNVMADMNIRPGLPPGLSDLKRLPPNIPNANQGQNMGNLLGGPNLTVGPKVGLTPSQGIPNITATPGLGEGSFLDLDRQNNSLEKIDSSDLARFLDSNLSDHLSSNLTLSESAQQSQYQELQNAQQCRQQGEGQINMTDSLTRLANTAIQDICDLNNMYKGGGN